jgi:hypothetical protein
MENARAAEAAATLARRREVRRVAYANTNVQH